MQNRRIIEGLLREAGRKPRSPSNPTLLCAHARTGRWTNAMPPRLAATLGLTMVALVLEKNDTQAVRAILRQTGCQQFKRSSRSSAIPSNLCPRQDSVTISRAPKPIDNVDSMALIGDKAFDSSAPSVIMLLN
jgi:hypothetical protein